MIETDLENRKFPVGVTFEHNISLKKQRVTLTAYVFKMHAALFFTPFDLCTVIVYYVSSDLEYPEYIWEADHSEKLVFRNSVQKESSKTHK